ncbi:MAG: zinc-binding dehydrogenase [Verrucomicrobia bacterium]|nr:zinc-binding dehydrogenase [Verrucomicrobiota bacterium]MBU1736049.1 zinc-binding dehydrogenase [Verrucomicrobiota bacterium]MBU1855833.1 zinc-binding dehydrogenase [Verrucomicrobiota bacterium]
MKAIVVTAPNILEFKDLPLPVPKRGQVRIRTTACGICATDLEMIGGWERTSFPGIPGHEWSGIVDAVGDSGDKTIIGRHCVAENVLQDGGEVGFEHPGGYAEYFLTETDKLHFLPDDFPMVVAALIEPLAVATRALRRLRLADKSSVLVIGDGPIGLLMTMLLKRAGAGNITLIGGRETRLALAKELGAERTLNYHHFGEHGMESAHAVLKCSFPNVIEASGATAAIKTALKLAAQQGKILVVGDYKKARSGFLWNHLLINELELIGSNASAQAWPEAVQTAIIIQKDLAKLISGEWAVVKFSDAVSTVKHNREIIKAILRWDI